MGCHALLQSIFLTQGSNLGFLHCRQILYHLSHKGNPKEWCRHVKRILKPTSKSFPLLNSPWGIQIYSIFMIHRSHICKSAYMLKFPCNAKINTNDNFSHSQKNKGTHKKFDLSDIRIPSWAQTSWHTIYLLQLLHYKKVSFSQSTQCHVFHNYCFFLFSLLFKKTPSTVLVCTLMVLGAIRRWNALRR